MLQIVCVEAGNYRGRGKEYVNKLFDIVSRNLEEGTIGKFVCFTDDPLGLDEGIECRELPGNLNGWWNKLYLFKRGLFPKGDRIVYLDLANIIVRGIDHFVKYNGDFGILRDIYRPEGLMSGIMMWESGLWNEIWEDYSRECYPEIIGGDQAWIERYQNANFDLLQDHYPGEIVSYKAQGTFFPETTRIVLFHGEPKPHQITDGWVPKVWQKGVGTSLELQVVCNTNNEQIVKNINYACGLPYPWVEPGEVHDLKAVIVCGGPSLKENIENIRFAQSNGAKVFATNNTLKVLYDNGIKADYHMMLDARAENAEFIIGDFDYTAYYGSTVSKNCFDKLEVVLRNQNINLFHPYIQGIETVLDDTTERYLIGGGTTVGLKSIVLAFTLGYREIHIFGMDSCYREDKHHAYDQSLNDHERILEFEFEGRQFKAAPWMVTQANEFNETANELVLSGCKLYLYGDGLINYMSGFRQPTDADERAHSIIERIRDIQNPIGVEVGVFAGDLSRRLLQRNDMKLYMVDSWKEHGLGSEYAKSGDFHGQLNQSKQEDYLNHTKLVTEFAKNRAIIIRKDSIEASKDFEDKTLDFVFLDADHTYEAVRDDIAAWYPKIKSGGYLCGHDYNHPTYPEWGVAQAVNELAATKGNVLEFGLNYTWFIQVGE